MLTKQLGNSIVINPEYKYTDLTQLINDIKECSSNVYVQEYFCHASIDLLFETYVHYTGKDFKSFLEECLESDVHFLHCSDIRKFTVFLKDAYTKFDKTHLYVKVGDFYLCCYQYINQSTYEIHESAYVDIDGIDIRKLLKTENGEDENNQ